MITKRKSDRKGISPVQIWKVKTRKYGNDGSVSWISGRYMEEKGMEYRIATISGDGIGPEIVREAKKVLDLLLADVEKYEKES